ncbi:uncharacterized protein [Triticum aestivum]|uniref:uncharacterized protein isoform X1 n=1 Tax=Triticum aestivum TaxID=4565 RepID=UPI001D00D629|nr:uncharacterized protein LOC123074059 isoform X1 [Triticum aestivum]
MSERLASAPPPPFRSPSPASADASVAPQVAVSLLPSSISSRVLPLHVLSLSLSRGQENPVASTHGSHLLPSLGDDAPSPVLAGLSSLRAPAKPASCHQALPLPDALRRRPALSADASSASLDWMQPLAPLTARARQRISASLAKAQPAPAPQPACYLLHRTGQGLLASVSFRSCEDSFDYIRLSSSWTRSSS